ncbi:MAG: Sulfonate transport system substrate-binding protein [Fibrobacteres bacterium]|nr:Sulfonate transport system substrate-binding protein [Fibrobacterota bacterium]
MKNRIIKIATLALATAALGGAYAENPKVIRFGYPGTGTGGRPYVGGSFVAYARAAGLLEQEFKNDGIKVDWTFFKLAGPAINEAFANKLLDISLLGDQAAIAGKAGGLNTKIILATGVRGVTYVVVPSDSPIQSLQDLKGKRVALFRGTAIQLAANRILEANGLSEKDIRSVNMDGLAAQAALASKDIDALFTIGSGALQQQDQGIGRIIYSGKQDDRVTGYASGLVVDGDFEKNNPQIVQRIVNVLVKAAQWSTDDKNREALLQSWAKSGTSYSAFKRDLEGQDLQAILSPVIDDYFRATWKKAVFDVKRFKFIRNDVNVDEWIEPKYARNALHSLNLENNWVRYAADGKPLQVTAVQEP